MGATARPQVGVFLSLIVVFVPPLPTPASARTATGHLDVYCNRFVLFLAKIDGAPASGKLVLFYRSSLKLGGEHFGQGKWYEMGVFRDGCVPAKCETIADGRVWIDALDTPPKHISGKYEIKLNGRLLEGTFFAKRRARNPLPGACT